MSRRPVAVDVDLRLAADADPRAPGAMVTVALCGHWEHDGPCRWPHNSRIDDSADPARLRTVAIVEDDERAEVLRRMEDGLRADDRWTVGDFRAREIVDEERALADRLSRGPTT
jgi:hypothetical protein